MPPSESQSIKLSEIVTIMREVFDDLELKLTAETTDRDIDGWDSLAHIQLVAALEEEFELEISASEIAEINSVAKILEIVGEKRDPKA